MRLQVGYGTYFTIHATSCNIDYGTTTIGLMHRYLITSKVRVGSEKFVFLPVISSYKKFYRYRYLLLLVHILNTVTFYRKLLRWKLLFLFF